MSIYDILVEYTKNNPNKTVKLYCLMCGSCYLNKLVDNSIYLTSSNKKHTFMLDKQGKFYEGGECMVFPNRDVEVWNVILWKPGTILYCNNTYGMFNGFVNDDFGRVRLKHVVNMAANSYLENMESTTESYAVSSNSSSYISKLEKLTGDKYNLATMSLTTFKNGDIVSFDSNNNHYIGILKEKTSNKYLFHIISNESDKGKYLNENKEMPCNIRLEQALDEDIKNLAEYMRQHHKIWDAINKGVISIYLTPFTKVLGREDEMSPWEIDLFEKFLDNCNKPYKCIKRSYSLNNCIPYEGNESLL